MPKPLRESPPSSAVAHLLDISAAARAVAPNDGKHGTPPHDDHRAAIYSPVETDAPHLNPVRPVRRYADVRANIKREFILSPATEETFDQLVDLLRRGTRTRLSSSHVARALLTGIGHCMKAIEREAKKLGAQKLPANAQGRESERERFESRLAQVLVAGIRASAAFEPEDSPADDGPSASHALFSRPIVPSDG